MKKQITFIFLLIGLVFLVMGCAGKSNEPASQGNANNEQKNDTKEEVKESNDKIYTLKFSTQSVPNDAHTKAIDIFKEEIEKSTNGQVKVENHNSGALYNQDSELQALMRGNLEMAYTSPPWLAELVPSVSMFTAGYMFKDYNHMTKVYNGEIGKKIFEQIAKETGVRPLGAFYLGARQINLVDNKEVKTPDDLKGVKLRMPDSPSWLFLGQALGANPTPIAFTELYMALNTGTVDGQDNPMPTVKNAKFYEVTKSLSLTNHIIDTVWPTINEKLWKEMGPELQQKIYDAIAVAQKKTDETNIQAEKELVEFFKQEGLTVTEPDLEAFSSHVLDQYLNNKEITANWDMDLFKQVQDMAD
ncbi:sialic acid TRAP transporter substrate-binding protein SiaP [Bacillus sp. S/N-304-OC-R1]|uniref:sialic acid TRAP transporter substrate-binding protein SiaP n=1 Tax=Bacillus sp. S/N-304-OC-R1 TaxID=2758034 RepID=UPI001C8EF34E|nr:sialic acid TRAP transporter substrate-binding protein SiaP [Bacillus sp. S/N-304-OC-R1]MBY0121457.1 sialic acid TRAP transporter substrate-binding protein SiaP [Bacillus sp. S/N-304-OC-R1]